MKKQGELFLKLTSILMAILLIAYAVLSLTLDKGIQYRLQEVPYCEVGDGISVSGFVVRQEEVLFSTQPVVAPQISEGKRVGGGQLVATGFRSSQVKQQRDELVSLERQRTELKQAMDGTFAFDGAALDRELATAIITLSRQTAQKQDGAETAAGLISLVLRQTLPTCEKAQLQSRMAELDRRIAALEQQLAPEAEPIFAPKAGYFSCVVDGMEQTLTPESLEQLSCAQLDRLEQQGAAPPIHSYGRLITGQTWYYVASVPTAALKELAVEDRIQVYFPGTALLTLPMTVERLQGEGENSLLVLSCNRQVHQATALRCQKANLIFTTYEGLLVSKEAVKTMDGDMGVFVLEGAKAQWKPIEVILEKDEEYLVAWDDSDTDNLWPRDELIITQENLSDGEVIKK